MQIQEWLVSLRTWDNPKMVFVTGRKGEAMSRLIDADELKKRIPITYADEFENCRRCSLLHDWEVEDIVDDAPTIVEFEGDINKVIVKGEEYHKQLTTTWLGNYCPYRCEHCGHYTDSKTPFCAWCGRKAVNYESK
jgi:hypothetical protein